MEVNPSNFFHIQNKLEKEDLCQHKFLINQISSLYTGVLKFPLDISVKQLSETFIEQNELRPILIKKYGELEKSIEILVFHHLILLTKLFTTFKKNNKKHL